MAIICSGYAVTATRIVGMWDAALHVQYVVSIANSAMDVDWLPASLPAWLRFITLWLAFYLSNWAGRPRKCWQRHCAFRSLACATAIVQFALFLFFSLFYFPAIFYSFFFVCSFFVGRTQPQHINFRTDIGQPFLQPVDAVRSVRHYQHGRVHFLLALL